MSSSKMVNDRQRAAAIVIQAAMTHADAVGARLDNELAPTEPGDGSGTGAAGLLRRLGQTLQNSIDELVEADRAHEAEKADDGEVRREYEEAIEGVYREVVDFRTGLEAVGSVAASTQAGFAGPTPREPIALVRLGYMLKDNMSKLKAVPAARRGITFDAMSYADPLATALKRLEEAQQGVRREQRELEATHMVKTRVMSAHDIRFLNIARTLEALFRLAGFHELADRVRPSTRRPGQTESEAETSEPGGEPDVLDPSADQT